MDWIVGILSKLELDWIGFVNLTVEGWPSVLWWLAMLCNNAPRYNVILRQKGRSRYFAAILFYAASHDALCRQDEGSALCLCDLCLHLGQLYQLPGLGVDMAKSRRKVARKTKVPRKRTLISGSGPWVASPAPLLKTENLTLTIFLLPMYYIIFSWERLKQLVQFHMMHCPSCRPRYCLGTLSSQTISLTLSQPSTI